MTGFLWSEGALLFQVEKSLDVTRQRDASRVDPGSEAAARYRAARKRNVRLKLRLARRVTLS